MNKFKIYLKTCRPNQWTKNLLVFSAPLFAFKENSINVWKSSLIAFLYFV